MTIDLSSGVTVQVTIPPFPPMVCPAPPLPGEGGVTMPTQGSLTPAQVASIVAEVTAKVIEAIGGQPGSVTWDQVDGKPNVFPPADHRHNASDIDGLPSGGGGGAGIDDDTISATSTWSSEKISGELDGKAADQSVLIDLDTGDLMPGPFPTFRYQVAALWQMALRATSEFGSGTIDGVEIVSTIPKHPGEGTLYAVRASDGTITWHMPNIG